MTNEKRGSKDPLEDKRESVQEMHDFIDEQVFSEDERTTSGEVSMVSQHPSDVAPYTYDRELEETVREILDGESAQIHEAQRRQAEGTYGACEQCGRPIAPERLQALPEATLCIDCQRAREARSRGA